ncbi:hypothetical protein Cocul_02067 [Corynebacterium oculi]|uniref:Uncharacterized protein n=1 Tax=Corynebacterium oculi TaxID=1544416 RepID=A0A0Q0Z1M9_9CORY|nr:hypothetical protein Cocul_02067 [Corynebacterium oculi]
MAFGSSSFCPPILKIYLRSTIITQQEQRLPCSASPNNTLPTKNIFTNAIDFFSTVYVIHKNIISTVFPVVTVGYC